MNPPQLLAPFLIIVGVCVMWVATWPGFVLIVSALVVTILER